MLKKLFIYSLFLFAFIVFFQTANAQRLYFCEDVSSDGDPIGASSSFTIRNEGDYLKFLVKLPYEVGCRSISYKIYRNGDYDNTVYQDTERSWVWFWKEISFYKTGEYDIYVYDCSDNLLASNTLRISWR
jgi:hypothetical protein